MSSVIVPVAAALLGSLVGAFRSYLGNRKMWEARAKREERQVAKALQGEIDAMVKIVELRDYAAGLRESAKAFREGRVEPFVVPIGQNYFTVFEDNASMIGALKGDLPRRVAQVYTLAKGIVDDFKGMGDKDWEKVADALQQLPLPARRARLNAMAEKHEQRAAFLEESMGDAADTAVRLREEYGESE